MNTTVIEPHPSVAATTPAAKFPEPHVVVRGTGRSFLQKIRCGEHELQADEPISFGGNNSAPDPHDYLMTALGACTSMMVGLQARNKKWPLEDIIVSLRHSRIPARDCAGCVTQNGMIDRIDMNVALIGPLTSEQHAALMQTAKSCPIHHALTHEINIQVRAANSEI